MSTSQLEDVLKRDGIDHWVKEVSATKRAVAAFAILYLFAAILGAILVAARMMDYDTRAFIYFVVCALTLWAGWQQTRIAPLASLNLFVHWIITLVFAFSTCGIVYFFYLFIDVKNAERRLEPFVKMDYMQRAQSPPSKRSMKPIVHGTVAQKAVHILASPEYRAWKRTLESYLQAKGSKMSVDQISEEALNYGFAHSMTAKQFFTDGITKSMSTNEFVERSIHLVSEHTEDETKSTSSSVPDVQNRELGETFPPSEVSKAPGSSPEVSRLSTLVSLYQAGAISLEEFVRLRDEL